MRRTQPSQTEHAEEEKTACDQKDAAVSASTHTKELRTINLDRSSLFLVYSGIRMRFTVFVVGGREGDRDRARLHALSWTRAATKTTGTIGSSEAAANIVYRCNRIK